MLPLCKKVFDALDLERAVLPLLDFEHAPRLYCGFLVQRSQSSVPNFHNVWLVTHHQTLTLITPGQTGDPPAGSAF
jgi:hypothetical protein